MELILRFFYSVNKQAVYWMIQPLKTTGIRLTFIWVLRSTVIMYHINIRNYLMGIYKS